MSNSAKRRLPRAAFVPLVALATYVTVGAIALVPDRGDDFQRLYVSATSWAHGGNPYAIVIADTPNLNHPLLLPLLWLFTVGSEHAGFIVWSVTSLVLFAACVPAISRHARIAPVDLMALILASTGSFLALVYGQVTFVLMAIFTAAWCADRKGASTSAGAMLGLLSVLKPFYGLFGLYLLWRREWRAFTAYAGVFVAGTLAGWAVVGTAGFFEWVARLREVQWRWHIYNASAWGVGDRLFTVQPFFRATGWTPLVESPQLARITTLLILLAVAGVLWWAVSKTDIDRSYALIGLACLLISPLGWLYYLPAFLGPVIVVLGARPSRWLWPIVAIGVWPYLFLVSRTYGKFGTLLVGQWALATVGGLFLLVAFSPRIVGAVSTAPFESRQH
jgi:Glycosyltransferase family 87